MAKILVEDIYVSGIDLNRKFSGLKSILKGVTGAKLKTSKIPILNGVTFEANSGDRVGILGLNGSGKSSLLRAICGIYTLDSGRISVEGKILPLIATGMEFESKLSGRENIKLSFIFNNNLSQYNEDIENEIIAFSELGDKIDVAVSQYSSGMMARLVMSSYFFQDGDILIMDEVGATGDASFIGKAQKLLNNRLDKSDVNIIVNHSVDVINKNCNVCYIMEKGRVMDFGKTDKMIGVYNKIYS